MTPQEARDLFSAAHDGELAAAEQAAFDAALTGDTALAAEYAAFRATLAAAAASGTPPPAAATDLLPGVQRRLRARSRGRFYADRFAERAGAGMLNPLTLTILMVALAALAWLVFGYLQHVEVK